MFVDLYLIFLFIAALLKNKSANRTLFDELIALRKEIKTLTTERKSQGQYLSPLSRMRFQTGQFGSSYTLSTSKLPLNSPLVRVRERSSSTLPAYVETQLALTSTPSLH